MAHVIMVTTPDLAAGFGLTGVLVRPARTATEVRAALAAARADPETALVGVHGPLLGLLDPAERTAVEAAFEPLVVAVPAGRGNGGDVERRERLTSLLHRAIGYRISFGREAS